MKFDYILNMAFPGKLLIILFKISGCPHVFPVVPPGAHRQYAIIAEKVIMGSFTIMFTWSC